jgi:hypothetical protein
LIENKVYEFKYKSTPYFEEISPSDEYRKLYPESHWIKHFLLPLPMDDKKDIFRYVLSFYFEYYYYAANPDIIGPPSGWMLTGSMILYTVNNANLGNMKLTDRELAKDEDKIHVRFYEADPKLNSHSFFSVDFNYYVLVPDDSHPVLEIYSGSNFKLSESPK